MIFGTSLIIEIFKFLMSSYDFLFQLEAGIAESDQEMSRALSRVEIFKGAIERSLSHFNESVNRQLHDLDSSVNLRNHDLSTEISAVKNSMKNLDQTKLIDIFSNRTIILRDQLVEKISDLKQRFVDNQKNVNKQQRIIDENSKTFMATVNAKLIESKHEFTALANKLSNVVKENNKIRNDTHKMSEEFRKNVCKKS